MKAYSLLAGLGICLGVTGVANAKVIQGTSEGYFTTMYATDLTGQSRLTQYDAQCLSKYRFYLNRAFYVDFRINDEEGGASWAALNYERSEVMLTGAWDTKTGGYFFKSEQLPQAYKDMHVKSAYFSVNNNYTSAYAHLALVGEAAVTPTPNPMPEENHKDCVTHCDKNNSCHVDHVDHSKHPVEPASVAYQCVLAAY